MQSGEDEAFWFLGNLATVKVDGGATGGRIAIVEFLSAPHSCPPRHVHRNEDEAFYVLEGEMTLHVDGTDHRLAPGGFALGPIGVPHTFSVQTETVRYLTVCAPSGFEGFVREVGEPAKELTLPPPPDEPPDLARVAELGARYGVEFV